MTKRCSGIYFAKDFHNPKNLKTSKVPLPKTPSAINDVMLDTRSPAGDNNQKGL